MTSANSSSTETTGSRLARPPRDRHDVLGEHVERVARHDGRLDLALAHQPRDDRALEQVGAELREDPALRRVADAVPGAADALQPARDGLRRLDLQDEVDGAHVDAELERRGGDEARQLAGLQQLLDDEALLAGERAVVGAGDVDGRALVALVGELVEPQREALRRAPVVDEDDRRAVLLDQLEQLRVDRGPDRAAGGLAAGQRVDVDGSSTRRRVGLDHRLDRHLDLQVERLAHARRRRSSPSAAGRRGSARPPRAGSASRSGRSAAARARSARSGARASARGATPRFVPATAWISSTITASTPVSISFAPRREDQVQRLGRRDEDVRRVAPHLHPLALRRVAGAQRDLQIGADPAQRRAQVALDVVGERLQRRDVDEARAGRSTARRPSLSSPHRNAASVLPEPVGAEMSTCSPPAMAGHACSWAGVGRSNAAVEPLADTGAEGGERHPSEGTTEETRSRSSRTLGSHPDGGLAPVCLAGAAHRAAAADARAHPPLRRERAAVRPVQPGGALPRARRRNARARRLLAPAQRASAVPPAGCRLRAGARDRVEPPHRAAARLRGSGGRIPPPLRGTAPHPRRHAPRRGVGGGVDSLLLDAPG